MTRFNNRRLADSWFGARWERLLPDENEYLRRAGKDDVPWENLDKSSNDTNYFPHVIKGGVQSAGNLFYKALDYTPFSNDLLEAFAEETITNEKLGAGEDPDILTLSFSANDYVGHRFGPYSQEAMDVTLRIDRQIGKLLDFVDARVGLRNTVVIFSADHGASPVPEQAALMNLPGRRYLKPDLVKLIQDGLKARYARKDHPATDYVQTFNNVDRVEDGADRSGELLHCPTASITVLMISSSGRSAFLTKSAASRSSPNISPYSFSGSVIPSVKNTSMSPGSSRTLLSSYCANGNAPTTIPFTSRRVEAPLWTRIGGRCPAFVYRKTPVFSS